MIKAFLKRCRASCFLVYFFAVLLKAAEVVATRFHQRSRRQSFFCSPAAAFVVRLYSDELREKIYLLAFSRSDAFIHGCNLMNPHQSTCVCVLPPLAVKHSMWGLRVTSQVISHVMQLGEVSSGDNLLHLLQLYSITYCHPGMSTTEFFHRVFDAAISAGNQSPCRQSLQACAVAINFPERQIVPGLFELERSLPPKLVWPHQLQEEHRAAAVRWILRDRMMTGEEQTRQ